MPAQPLMTLADVMAYLRISRITAYRWLSTGRLHGFKLGQQWRFRQDDLQNIGRPRPRRQHYEEFVR